jgi:hypothetical protein
MMMGETCQSARLSSCRTRTAVTGSRPDPTRFMTETPMRATLLRVLLLSTALAAGPAAAQGVDAKGATDLAQSLATYLGQSSLERGVLRVEPAGDAYRVTLDLQKLANGVVKPEDKASVTISPIVFTTTPKSDGTWAVKADSYPKVSLRHTGEKGEDAIDFSVEGYSLDGIYDPKIKALVSGADKSSGIKLTSRSADEDIDVAYGATSTTYSGAAKGSDAADIGLNFKSASLLETITMKGDTPMTAVVKTGEITADFAVSEARSPALLEILAFFAANPDKPKIVANQEDLRKRLLAALPLWASNAASVAAKDISVETPLGTFKTASFAQTMGSSGMAKDGHYDVGIAMSGFEAPTGALPGWMKTVLPTDLDLKIAVSGLDLDAIAHAAIEEFDLSKDDPWSEGTKGKIAGLLSTGTLKITLPPSKVASPSLTLSIEGNGTVMPEMKGTATLTADGLDKTLADLAAAPDADPNRQQALMMLGVAKNLAKPGEGGKSVWTFDAAADGSVSVNGQMIQPPTK